MTLYGAVVEFDVRLEEAARTIGANEAQAIFKSRHTNLDSGVYFCGGIVILYINERFWYGVYSGESV